MKAVNKSIAMNSGVLWADMHRLAERVLLTELKEMGLLQGEARSCILHKV